MIRRDESRTRAAIAALALAVAAPLACSSSEPPAPAPLPCPGPSQAGSPLSIRCGALVDRDGREVTLTGINARVGGVFDVSFDDGRAPLEPIPAFGADDARRIRELGFDALRLPIQWSGVEPTETGGFDEAYLDRVASAVALARAARLYVLVDLHQDAYSKEIGEDGAPYWAIVPPPPAKLGGPLVDLDARRLSKPVLDAFGTFFGPSADGVRLRERYARMAAHVAARFAEDDAVIGIEAFNEPIAKTPELVAFHREVLAAVRSAAPKKLVFFEPSATRNLLDRADLPSSPLGPGTVYAPHVYTAAFATEAARATVTREAVQRSYVAAREEADAWQAPLVVTEWGFPPSAPNFPDYARWHAELAEEVRAHLFFWVWKETSQGSWGFFDGAPGGAVTERANVVAALARVRLEVAAGRIASLARPTPTRLRVEIEGVPGSRENLVSFGARWAPRGAWCDGATVAVGAAEPAPIACGGEGRHVLEIESAPR